MHLPNVGPQDSNDALIMIMSILPVHQSSKRCSDPFMLLVQDSGDKKKKSRKVAKTLDSFESVHHPWISLMVVPCKAFFFFNPHLSMARVQDMERGWIHIVFLCQGKLLQNEYFLQALHLTLA